MMKFLATPYRALLLMSVALCGCASVPAGPVGLALKADGKPVIGKAEVAPSDLEGAIRQAQLQRLAGDLDGATHTLGQLVLIAPDDPRVLGEYGKTLVAKGEADDALAFLAQAIAFQPNDWMLYSAQGVAYDQRGDYVSAQEAYNRALNLKPGDPGVLSNAGLSRMQAGDLQGAEVLLRAAAQNGADNARITQNLALVQSLKDSKRPVIVLPAVTPAAEVANARPAADQATAPLSAPTETVAQTPLARPATSPTPLTGVAALAADPTVVMAPIPRDDVVAKPVKAKPAAATAVKAPALKPAIAPAPTQKVAVDANPPTKLRPAQ